MESQEGVIDLRSFAGEESISIKQQSAGSATHHSSIEAHAGEAINPPHYSEKNYLLQNQPPLVGNIPFPEEAPTQDLPIMAERLSSANSSTSRKKRALFASGSNASSGGRGRQKHQSSGKTISSQEQQIGQRTIMSDEEGQGMHSGLELIEVNSEELLTPLHDPEEEQKEEAKGSRVEEGGELPDEDELYTPQHPEYVQGRNMLYYEGEQSQPVIPDRATASSNPSLYYIGSDGQLKCTRPLEPPPHPQQWVRSPSKKSTKSPNKSEQYRAALQRRYFQGMPAMVSKEEQLQAKPERPIVQNNYYINYYQGGGAGVQEPKKQAVSSIVHPPKVKDPSMEDEELMHRLEELRNENQLNTCFAQILREQIFKTMKKIYAKQPQIAEERARKQESTIPLNREKLIALMKKHRFSKGQKQRQESEGEETQLSEERKEYDQVIEALFPLNARQELNASKLRDLAPLSYEALLKENAELTKKIKALQKKLRAVGPRLSAAKEALHSPQIDKYKQQLKEVNSYITYLHNKASSYEDASAGVSQVSNASLQVTRMSYLYSSPLKGLVERRDEDSTEEEAIPFSKQLVMRYMKDVTHKENMIERMQKSAAQMRKEEGGDLEKAQRLEKLAERMKNQMEVLRARKMKFLKDKGDLQLVGYQIFKMQQGELMFDRVQRQEEQLREKYKLVNGKLQTDNAKLKLELTRLTQHK